jgi:hypothetical protein
MMMMMMMMMMIIIIIKIKPCSPLRVYRHFGELVASIFRVGEVGNQSETGSKLFFGLLLDPEGGGGMFFRSIGRLSTDYTALHPRGWNPS